MTIQRLALILGSVALTTLCLEWAFRLFLDSRLEANSSFQDPSRYADPLREDSYWLLWQRWNPPPSFTRDAELGWVGAFRPSTYIHNDRHTLKGRRPVLLFGDSFSACVPEEKCFEDLLENDLRFSESHRLINYGVGGYGLDQIMLLLEKVAPIYPDAIVIFGLMTLDLDRSQLQMREASKPFFEAHKDGYRLKSPDMKKERRIPSFPSVSLISRLILHSYFMPKFVQNALTSAEAQDIQNQSRTLYLLNRANSTLQNHTHHFLIFHPRSAIEKST